MDSMDSMEKNRSGSGLRFIFTGGGSGGHVSPGLAVAAEVKNRLLDAQIIYAGIKGKAEARMVPKAGIALKFVNSAPMPGKHPLKLLGFSFIMLWGIIKALLLVLKIRPHLVFATGGYVSAPVIFATGLLKKMSFGALKTKILIHESNLYPGKMNKLAATIADAVCVAFSETISKLPGENSYYSGYPVRELMVQGDRHAARKALGIPEKAFTVFAFGGSQGSRTINRALAHAAPLLLADPDVYVLHGAGRPFGNHGGYNGFKDVTTIRESRGGAAKVDHRYKVKDFIDNMALYYAASDLVVIRAGAGSIMEVCNLGKPCIIIPISSVYSDHQTGNARYVEKEGAAVVLYEKNDLSGNIDIPFLEPEKLAEAVFALKKNPEKLSEMSRKAVHLFPGSSAAHITDHILFLCDKAGMPEKMEKKGSHPQDRILGQSSTRIEHLLRAVQTGKAPPLDPDETKLLENKINAYFTGADPILRTRALRIAGLAAYEPLFPFAVACAMSLAEKPFVRRDAFVSLGSLITCGAADPRAVISAAFAGLSDPYYEARFCAARLVTIISRCRDIPDHDRARLLHALYDNFKDRCFEVRMEAILAVASIETDKTHVTAHFQACYYDKVWKVRKALFAGYDILVSRKIVAPLTALAELDKILITSDGYTAEYELKQQFNKSRSRIKEAEVS